MRTRCPIPVFCTAARALALAVLLSCHDADVTSPVKGSSLVLTPPTAVITVGDSVGFTATTRTPGSFRWTTSAPDVVSVSDGGVARGLAPGRSTVTVVVGGLTGAAASALVEVRAP